MHLYPKGVNYLLPTPIDTIREVFLRKLNKFPETYRFFRYLFHKMKNEDDKIESSNQSTWLKINPAQLDSNLFQNNHQYLPHFDALSTQLYNDFHFTILPTILRNFDRLSMAHGVEIRAPFLDWRLVCFMFSLPSESKLGGGTTKRILREAMRGVLPEEIRRRRNKVGFMSPIEDWYKGSLKYFVLDSINSKLFLESDIWNGPLIRNFVEDAYLKKDYQSDTKSWKYIQAYQLMKLFKEKRISNFN